MSQEIQTVGERADAICGAKAKTPAQQAENLNHETWLLLNSAYRILSVAFEPAGKTHVAVEVCDGVIFLCKAAIRNCDELVTLGHMRADDIKTDLLAAVGVLDFCHMDADGLTIDATYGATIILKAVEKGLDKLFDDHQGNQPASPTVLQ